jgi:hypothetical protein
MTEPVDPTLTEPPGPARLNAGRLWAGGVATAVVAALVVVAGVYIARGILGIPVLAPRAAGSLGSSTTAVINLVACVAVISLLTGVARGAVRPRPAESAPSPHMQPR